MMKFIFVFLLSISVNAEEVSYLVEFKHAPKLQLLETVKKLTHSQGVTLFDDFDSDYFKRLYKFKAEKLDKDQIIKIENLLEVAKLETSQSIETFSITPSEGPAQTNDAFFNYQWGLLNSQQIVYKDIDDIHLDKVVGIKGADIGWSEIHKNIDSSFKRDVVVAVLDSGVDINHPDLKNNIYKNTKECKGGRVPSKPTEDLDANGYVGDCAGWSFTSKKEQGENRVADRIGHGTHVAGIIAAEKNNGIGISGVSNRIKILPVKVLHKNEGRGSRTALGLSDRVAKGVLYAVKMRVDVINLSLGWPISVDTKFLREAFRAAIKNNIVIVAAAGNNNNDQQIYPCSYEHVLCVGSLDNNNVPSGFSNFGGHVDVLAPGDHIISTFPESLDPVLFSVKGYEVKNGTSQAAPFVSALAGVLRGVEGLSRQSIVTRILASTKAVEVGNKNFQFGRINYQAAMLKTENDLIVPNFKSLNTAVVDARSKLVRLTLPIQNLASKKSRLKVTATMAGKTQVVNVGSMQAREVKNVSLTFKVNDLSENSKAQFSININDKYNYLHNFRISTSFSSVNKESHQMHSSEIKDLRQLRTLSMIGLKNVQPEFYTQNIDEDKMSLSLYKLQFNKYVRFATVHVASAQKLLNFYKMDVDYDGVADYWTRSIVNVGDESQILYSYYDSNFQLMYEIPFQPEVVVLPTGKFKFLPYEVPELGRLAVPVFISKGRIPESDQNTDPFEKEGSQSFDNIYFFSPENKDGVVEFKTHVFNKFDFLQKLRDQLNLSFRESIEPIQIYPQADFKTLTVLLSVGEGFNKLTYLLSLDEHSLNDATFALVPVDYQGERYQGHQMKEVINLDNNALKTTFTGFFTSTLMRVSFLHNHQLEESNQVQYFDNKDHILGYLASFQKGGENISMFQTKNHLVAAKFVNGEVEITRKPITRFSFLRGTALTELFFPMSMGRSEDQKPAIYVDTTQLSSSYIYSWYLSNDGNLKSPIRLTVDIPKNCRAMNPAQFNGQYHYTVFCKSDENLSINFVPVE